MRSLSWAFYQVDDERSYNEIEIVKEFLKKREIENI